VAEVELDSLSSQLPRRIAKLTELAYNLWWTWHPEVPRLFQRIDRVLWETVYHNPVKFLRQVEREALRAAYNDKRFTITYDRTVSEFNQYMSGPAAQSSWFAATHRAWARPAAYFSFEFGLHECLPMYAGGLGVLAGDHLKQASDLGVPMVGVGFLYLQGYFRQRITEDGWQEADLSPIDFSALPITRVTDDKREPLMLPIALPNRLIWAQIWKAQVGRVPLYLLDTDVPKNLPGDRELTYRLYNPDPDTRIAQEIVLGIGGVRALRALGYQPRVWHMNEGHPAFSTLERVRELVAEEDLTFERASERVRQTTIFTTHTPVPAGNDQFQVWQIERQFNGYWKELGLSREEFMALGDPGGTFNMTVLALKMAARSNAVSALHGQVSRDMWQWLYADGAPPITHITNGVHTETWLARRMHRLYDEYLGPGWVHHIDDPATWEPVHDIPDGELWAVRKHYKRRLASFMGERARRKWVTHSQHPVQTIASGVLIEPNMLTIGFARRFATYKRAYLIMRDIKRLLRIVNNPYMPVQILFAGKAHPNDEPGKRLIQDLYRNIKNADSAGRLVFIEDYDIQVARQLVQGVDVWLNTPRRPHEASGTSGMKVALNGGLNFSILDGWWAEAYNGKNGWAIGDDRAGATPDEQDAIDAESVYATLENEIVPLFYNVDDNGIPHQWVQMVKASIATIAPCFSTMRMVKQYVDEMYAPLADAAEAAEAAG
jgi:starch phosphorylase